MTGSYVFCPACGCPFDSTVNAENDPFAEDEDTSTQYFSPEVISEDMLEWLDKVRLLARTSCLDGFLIDPYHRSGEAVVPNNSKNESEVEGMFVSEEVHWDTEKEFELAPPEDRLCTTFWADARGDVVFPIHSACLELVRRVITARNESTLTSKQATIETFYDALCKEWARIRSIVGSRYSVERSNYDYEIHGEYGLEWEHKYYGVRDLQDYHGLVIMRGDEWYCADPINISGLPSFISNALPKILVPSIASHVKALEISESFMKSRLEGLPSELINQIASHLPISSVFALRLCSNTLAIQLNPDQQFWRQRLLSGTLVPYMWDLDTTELLSELSRRDASSKGDGGTPNDWNWKAVARLLCKSETMLRERQESPIGFRNRCRIWKIIEVALDSVDTVSTK